MWRENPRRSNLRTSLMAGEVLSILIIFIALMDYLWKYTIVGEINQDFQIMVFGIFAFLGIMATSFVINRMN